MNFEGVVVKSILIFVLIILSFSTYAIEVSKIDLGLEARVRAESRNNKDFMDNSGDRLSYTASRFRLQAKATLDETGNYLFFQPQFTKTWGQEEVTANDGAATTSSQSSGALNDTGLDTHQAYIYWKPIESLSAIIGRQEFNYGDQLLVGAVGWHNIGRSFDALKIVFQITDGHKLDIFRSKLVDENISSSSNGDFDFSGIYYSGSFGEKLKALDVYIFDKADHRSNTDSDIYTFGLRAKSKIKSFDYRFEGNTQTGRKISGVKKDGNQFDIELGYNLEKLNIRLGAEYFSASKDFDQLFPTAHKWLGLADFYQRRNIKGYVIHLGGSLKKLSYRASYHMFKRNNTDGPAYNFGGTSLGTVGTSDDLGNEIDLTLGYNWSKSIKFAAGYALVKPGSYQKDQNASSTDTGHWSFLQMLAKY